MSVAYWNYDERDLTQVVCEISEIEDNLDWGDMSVADLLNIADDGTLRHLSDRLDVSNGEGCLSASIDSLHGE